MDLAHPSPPRPEPIAPTLPRTPIERRKIGVVGCGAVGSFYGAKLWQAGQDVHFLLRSDHQIVRAAGVHIHSVAGDFQAHPHVASRPEELGPCDLVLIGLKTTANAVLAQWLPPLVRPDTLVLTLQNGLGNEAHLAALLGDAGILGGLCFVCLNRTAPGVVRHLAHGQIAIGEYRRAPLPRTWALADLFQRAGVACAVAPDLEQAHWEKLVWNIPFNGLGVGGIAGYDAVRQGGLAGQTNQTRTLPTSELLADPRWEGLVRDLMIEVIAAANALGHALPRKLAEEMIARTRCMGDYRASTLLDYEQGRPVELESLFLEPLRRAQAARVPTPRLAALCAVLRALDGARTRAHRPAPAADPPGGALTKVKSTQDAPG